MLARCVICKGASFYLRGIKTGFHKVRMSAMRTIKQLLMTVAVLLYSVAASAYDFEVDGIYYKITSASDLTVSVTRGDNKYAGDVVVPSAVTHESNTYAVTNIEGNAFNFSMGLTSVTIPGSVKYFGIFAFSSCFYLESVTFLDGVKSIADYAFENCKGLTSVTIGNTVTYIGEYAFASCNSLTSVSIPNSVTTIGQFAFQGCGNLASVTIGNSVTTIGQYAFQWCSNLATITIPSSVTMIEDYAFAACGKLASIYLLGEMPPSFYNMTEEQCAKITLYVPSGSLETYRNADKWKNFQNIREFDVTGIGNTAANDVAIRVTANGIMLTDAEGKAVTVYSANGALVEKTACYTGEEIALGRGVYIVHVGNKTLKVKK